MALRLLCVALLFLATTDATYPGSACTRDYCKKVQCPSVSVRNCRGRITRIASLCGCCYSCLPELGLGQKCLPLFHKGKLPRAICKSGLDCDPKRFVCTKRSS